MRKKAEGKVFEGFIGIDSDANMVSDRVFDSVESAVRYFDNTKYEYFSVRIKHVEIKVTD